VAVSYGMKDGNEIEKLTKENEFIIKYKLSSSPDIIKLMMAMSPEMSLNCATQSFQISTVQ
jgi:hypothetical protein